MRPYEQGQQAYRDGRGISDNPFVTAGPGPFPGADEWLLGFKMAAVLDTGSKVNKAVLGENALFNPEVLLREVTEYLQKLLERTPSDDDKAERQRLEGTVAQLTARVHTLESSLDQAVTERSHYELEVCRLRGVIAGKEAGNDELERIVRNLRGNIGAKCETIGNLETSLNSIMEAIEQSCHDPREPLTIAQAPGIIRVLAAQVRSLAAKQANPADLELRREMDSLIDALKYAAPPSHANQTECSQWCAVIRLLGDECRSMHENLKQMVERSPFRDEA